MCIHTKGETGMNDSLDLKWGNVKHAPNCRVHFWSTAPGGIMIVTPYL